MLGTIQCACHGIYLADKDNNSCIVPIRRATSKEIESLPSFGSISTLSFHVK